MHVYICTVPAKVPCKHVVELARASLATNPDAGLPIREFAAIRPADAEVVSESYIYTRNPTVRHLGNIHLEPPWGGVLTERF